MVQESYISKPNGYFGNVRRELIDEVPIGSNAVLEVGCGEGNTGEALKAEFRARWVTGIELFESAAQKATYVLDQVLTGNIEHIALPFVEGQFDAILLGDVLEHLVDPWSQVNRLVSYLSPNGVLVASLPNVRNWRVIIPLIFLGKWDYQHFGIMDRTHLRFFTRRSIIELFEENGLSIKKIVPLGEKSKVISRLHVGFLSEFAAPQYLVVCTRKTEGTRVR
jgi:2-polyprenyl-3-methyl-5-hydroxy-6-metoxy-1,4-benzoquinol methylase